MEFLGRSNDAVVNGQKARRRIVRITFLGGLIALLGFRRSIVQKKDVSETVKMITSDGKVVEVDTKNIPAKEGNYLSNVQLKNWLLEERIAGKRKGKTTKYHV